MSGFEVLGVADYSYDMVLAFAPARAIGEGKHGLDHLRVRIVVGWGEHDNRFRALGVSYIQVIEVEWGACSADHAHLARVAYLLAYLVFHLDLVFVGENDYARLGFAFVGGLELSDYGEYL